jgi:hypothetical protein
VTKLPAKPPANWPFPTWDGKPLPRRRQPKPQPPALPDAPF